MTQAMHHISKRKRIHQKYEKYPHPNKWKRLLDDLVYIAGIILVIMTIPQAYNIWSVRSAIGVSLLTWITYFFVAVISTIYGFVHKEKPIILTHISLAVVELVIIVGIVLYS